MPDLGVEHRRAHRAGRVDDREHRRRGHVAEARGLGLLAVEVDGVVLADRQRVLADLLLAHLVRRTAGRSSRLPQRSTGTARQSSARRERRYAASRRPCASASVPSLRIARLLDLPRALARELEQPRHLVERARRLADEAVAQRRRCGARGRAGCRAPRARRSCIERLGGRLERRHRALVGDQLAELGGVGVVADRLVERHQRLRGAQEHVRLDRVHARERGDLLDRGIAVAGRLELALGAVELLDDVVDVDRDPDRAALVGDRARDRLADPPGGVGRELEALAVVELLDRADEADRALLDQVEEGQALVAVALGDRDHEAQVGARHVVLRVEVAALDALGEGDLLLGGQQRRRRRCRRGAAGASRRWDRGRSARRFPGSRPPTYDRVLRA